jgi:hypothetical protein
MEILFEHAELLDKLLDEQINSVKGPQFSINSVRKELNYNDQLASLLYQYIIDATFNNIPIVDTNSLPNGYYRITDNTMKFIKDGGFTSIYRIQVQDFEKRGKKDELEFKNLELGPKQHRFNKISVWINAGLTFITIVLTVLIALGIIGKKN